MGPEQGLKLTERTRGASVHLVRKPGSIIEHQQSRNFQRHLERETER
jgi:hypothetical protein